MRHFGLSSQLSIMRVALVLSLVIAAAVAAPPPLTAVAPDSPVTVVKSYVENSPNGNYKFFFELSDGSAREEEGVVRNEGQEDQYIFVKGYYTYVGPDRLVYRTNYESGTEGFKSEVEEQNEGPGAIPPGLAASLIG